MEFLIEYGLFLAKTITIVVAILAAVGGTIALSSRGRPKAKERLEVRNLNRTYESMARTLQTAILPRRQFKKILKLWKKHDKAKQKQHAGAAPSRKVFVLNFHGDIQASAVASLRKEITAILMIATPEDEVVLRLESGGGLVHVYGLAASQLLRIKEKKIALTITVDKIAASGGYMMACVADRLIASPFAVIGSIGVVSQLPNFHRLLKKNGIDFEQFTAGEYKRTITLFGENTDKARDKLRQEIEDTHLLFKDFVKAQRSHLDIAQVATGEYWFGARALELKLVDELRTSDDYLMQASEAAQLFEVTYASRKKLATRLLSFAMQMLQRR